MLFLVVDDDALSRELVTVLLEEEGDAVEAFASGEDAIARIADASLPSPDVILTDMQMPGLKGVALAKALKIELRAPAMLIAMSGSHPAPAALRSFDGFLLKPFQMGQLKSMIATPGRLDTARAKPGPDGPDTNLLDVNVLDEDIYTKLGELMPPEQLGQMYALCVGDARKRIVHMRSLAEAGDDAQYRAEAHTVKGGTGMIGAKQLYELATVAERDGITAAEDVPGTTSVTAALTHLSLACDRLERILMERTRA